MSEGEGAVCDREVKAPWGVEIEMTVGTGDDPSIFFGVRRLVADAKDLHLVIEDEDGMRKVKIPRDQVRKVMLMSS